MTATKQKRTRQRVSSRSNPPSQKAASEARRVSQPVSVVAWLGRIAMLAILAVLPWHYGSVTWSDQTFLVYAIVPLAAYALILAFVRGKLFLPRFAWVPVVFVGLAVLQVLPLPSFIVGSLSANPKFENQISEIAAELTPGLISNADAPVPQAEVVSANTLSLYPTQTLASLCMFATAVLFMGSANVLFDSRKSQIAMMIVLATTIFAHALLGLYEKVNWAGWTLLDVNTESFSTLMSRNSAPPLYAIGVGCVLGMLMSWTARETSASRDRRYQVRYPAANLLAKLRRKLEDLLADQDAVTIALLLISCILFFVTVATLSRGGILATAAALVALGARTFQRPQDRIRAIAFLLVLSAIAFGLMVLLGFDEAVKERFTDVVAESQSGGNGRYQVWTTVMQEASYWIVGSGLGTFHFAMLPLQQSGPWAYHAESIYVEAWVEFGILGMILALFYALFVSRTLFKAANQERFKPIGVCVTFAFVCIALHSLVDFSAIIPTIFLPLAAMLGAYAAIQFTKEAKSLSATRLMLDRAVTVGLILVAVVALPSLIGFAEGESLRRHADANNAIWEMSGESDFPEIALQMARIEQNNVQLEMHRDLSLDPALESVRGALTRPERMAAVFRAPDESELKVIQPALIENRVAERLNRTVSRAALAAEACPLDWRASWAIFRGDCGTLTPEQRARNYARLWLCTTNQPKVQQQIGTIALNAGEKEVGIRFWNSAIETHPNLANNAGALMQLGLNISDLQRVVSGNPQNMLRLARRIRDEETVDALLSESETSEFEPANNGTSEDWSLYAWLANRRGENTLAINAQKKAAVLAPMDGEVRMRLAELQEESGDLSAAAESVREAIRRAGSQQHYREKLDSLEAEIKKATPVE